MPSANQLSHSGSIIRQSLIMLLVGLLWGIYVPQTPFPRLSLVAHIEAMTNGPMWLGIGAVLQTDFMNVGDFGLLILRAGLVGNWVWLVVEALNGWWGTKFLNIAAEQAGAAGATDLLEAIVAAAHIIPAITMITGFGVLIHAAYFRAGLKKKV